MCRIYLVRHGETVWNREGRLQGQRDSPLTETGIRQARAHGHTLARMLAGREGADTGKDGTAAEGEGLYLHASPLGRTRHTARLLRAAAGLTHLEIRHDDRLKEITLGDHDGYPGWAALDRDFPDLARERRANPWYFRHPGGESTEMVRLRLLPFLEGLQGLREGATHIVVAHGVTNKVLRGLYLGLTEAECYALDRRQDGFHLLEGGREQFIESFQEA